MAGPSTPPVAGGRQSSSAVPRTPSGRLIHQAGTRARLFDAIAAVPIGAKLSISGLRDALVNQADVLWGIESLIGEELLDRATLRPMPAAEPATCDDAEQAATVEADHLPTGAELADRLEALIAEHGLSRTRVGLKIYGNRDGVSVLRHANPRRATVARILALLADPPIEDLKPRDAWASRRAKREVMEVIEPGGCAPPVITSRKPGQAPLSFEEQVARVERGEVGIGPNVRIGRPDPAGTLGGVTGEINL
jgi:hypothetical protein